MALERMRLIDVAHAWAKGTHSTYQTKLKQIKSFESLTGVQILSRPFLVRPPSSSDISLMWIHELLSTRRSTSSRYAGLPPDERPNFAYGTLRALRSASSQHEALVALSVDPASVISLDKGGQLVRSAGRFTDSYNLTLFTRGLSSRIGETSVPSVALLDRHVRGLDVDLRQRFSSATTAAERRSLARAGCANLYLYLGWLRGGEVFGVRGSDNEIIFPTNGPSRDLPAGVGAILVSLDPRTKSSRSKTADVAIAFRSATGYSLGWWLAKLAQSLDLSISELESSPLLLFRHENGQPWTSQFFRETYLYPFLYRLREAGDAYLRPFDGSPGNSIPEKIYSLHCYRRGGRSHVTRPTVFRQRKATVSEIYEHGRWRLRRSSENIDKIYNEWTLFDRLQITLWCY